MEIRQKPFGDIVVLSLKGNLIALPDAANLRELIYGLLGKDKKLVVLDMGGVSAINSSGLGAIVAALTSLRRRGGDLRLTRLSKKVEGALVMTRLINVFKIYEDPQRAVESFTK